MSRIQANSAATVGQSTSASRTSGIEDLDLQSFFDLMIAELQNQDPLNPMDNQEMLAQIGQLREISSNDKLSETLESVLLGQNFSSATTLIGEEVTALTDQGDRVTGVVQKVTMNEGKPLLDLAVQPNASAASNEGDLDPGNYQYEVVWQNEDGEAFSILVNADTNSLSDFKGALELTNLPETDGPKRVYRTDRNGAGSDGKAEKRFVGELENGGETVFIDVTADGERDREKLPTIPDANKLKTANRVTVNMKNVGELHATAK